MLSDRTARDSLLLVTLLSWKIITVLIYRLEECYPLLTNKKYISIDKT